MRKESEIATAFDSVEKFSAGQPVFMVGIGGAGMSALAKLLQARGHVVSGTDASASPATEDLISHGFQVHIGHTADGIEKGMALVVTDAIDLDASPEVARAKELGLPIFRRSQILGWVLGRYRLVAITGTHGKTTTTGLMGQGFAEAGVDPVVVVGAHIPGWGSSTREGKGEWAVAEACEAYDSFHDLNPEIVLLTNLQPDHLDFHGTFEAMRASVERFCMRAATLVYCAEDEWASELASRHPHADPYTLDESHPLTLIGRHNRLNASGVAKVSEVIGLDREKVWAGMAKFAGAERRLQVIQEGPVTVLDDYAHHPDEIRASLQAVRERYPNRRIVVAFQPHLYSRTQEFLREFAEELSAADRVYLTDIYPAREAPIPGISSVRIAELMKGEVFVVPSRHLLPRTIAQSTNLDDVVIGMGAGTIQSFAPEFVRELGRGADGKLKILVAKGGDSAEREVSLHSGAAIARALESKGYDVKQVDLSELLLTGGSLKSLVGPERPDLVFLAVHGTHAEDGAIQGFLEMLGLPYTGSRIQSSALAMDKERTKQILGAAGLPVPKGKFVTHPNETIEFDGPYVVKPNAQGSTVGLSFVENRSELAAAIERALRYDASALVEERLVGMEISVPVLGDRALLPVEIAPTSGVYDFASKYEKGATEEIVPARLSEEVIKRTQEYALRAHQEMGCRGATRTDMIVVGNQDPVILEVNTLPGMTATSLLPNSAAAMGISMEDLCDWIVKDALGIHQA